MSREKSYKIGSFLQEKQIGFKIRFWGENLYILTITAAKARSKSVEETKNTGVRMSAG